MSFKHVINYNLEVEFILVSYVFHCPTTPIFTYYVRINSVVYREKEINAPNVPKAP